MKSEEFFSAQHLNDITMDGEITIKNISSPLYSNNFDLDLVSFAVDRMPSFPFPAFFDLSR